MAAVPISEDSVFTSYLYVRTAYSKLSNGIEAQLGSNPQQLNTLHSQYSSNEKVCSFVFICEIHARIFPLHHPFSYYLSIY